MPGIHYPYTTTYTSFHKEMIARTSHAHPTYAADNKHVFNIINKALADTSYISLVKKISWSKDGRGAYKALCTHNLGSSKWETLIDEAEQKVTRTEWNRKSHRYTLVKHIASHRNSHNDMQRATSFITYQTPTEATRVTHLLNSIN